ncbi:MAG: hypothetical protein JHC85_04150 [Chthoniobacterales bacterium]|nr:hypothetical protein [Chthoniobacterales bacterium]
MLLVPLAVLVLVVLAFLVVGLMSPQALEFDPKTLNPTYDGQPKKALLLTARDGLQVEYSVRPDLSENYQTNPPTKAGYYKARVQKHSWLFGSETLASTNMTIERATASIKFDPKQLRFKEEARSHRITPIIQPNADPATKWPIECDVHYLKKNDTNSQWTTNPPVFSGDYRVEAQIKSNPNYLADPVTTNFVIVRELTPTANRGKGGEPSVSRTPINDDIKTMFVLADMDEMLEVLKKPPEKGGLPAQGKLEVIKSDATNKIAIDPEGRVLGKQINAFKMSSQRLSEKKGEFMGQQMSYIVSGTNSAPKFVAIELRKGDNKAALQNFFDDVKINKITNTDALAHILFIDRSSLPNDLNHFRVPEGGQFILEIKEHPYTEKNPLKIPIDGTGKLDRKELVQLETLQTLKPKEGSAQEVASKYQSPQEAYFNDAKSVLVSEISRKSQQISQISRNNQQSIDLQKCVDQINAIKYTPDQGQSALTNVQVAVLLPLLRDMLKVVSTDPDTWKATQQPEQDRKNNQQNSGGGPVAGAGDVSKMPPDQLTPDEFYELQKKTKAENALKAAQQWLGGREASGSIDDPIRLLKLGVDKLSKESVAYPSQAAGEESKTAAESMIQEKIDLLNSIGTTNAYQKKGRLMLEVSSNHYILWTNVPLGPKP